MKYHISILALILSLSSCKERMDIKLNDSPTQLCVEAKVTSDLQNHYVKLSESSHVFFNKEEIPITKAIVSVSDGTTTFPYEETSSGIYKSIDKFAGIPEKTYSLKVTNVDIDKDGKKEEYTAKSKMCPPYRIDKIEMCYDPKYEDDDGDKRPHWLLELYMKDNAEQKDFYAFATRINNKLIDDTITEVLALADTYFDGNETLGFEVGVFDPKKPDEIIRLHDQITLETYAITEDYCSFIKEFIEMDEEQLPLFSGPPANIRTNISNGALGYFAVYSISRIHTKVKSIPQ